MTDEDIKNLIEELQKKIDEFLSSDDDSEWVSATEKKLPDGFGR
jgi:hypothetical protein